MLEPVLVVCGFTGFTGFVGVVGGVGGSCPVMIFTKSSAMATILLSSAHLLINGAGFLCRTLYSASSWEYAFTLASMLFQSVIFGKMNPSKKWTETLV